MKTYITRIYMHVVNKNKMMLRLNVEFLKFNSYTLCIIVFSYVKICNFEAVFNEIVSKTDMY